MISKSNLILYKWTALISAVFTMVLTLMLLLNYWNYKQTDPVENQTILALVERLKQEPNNEVLIQEIRQLDLIARKAYFTAQWQINTGALLALIGAILFVIAVRQYKRLSQRIDLPSMEDDSYSDKLLSEKWVLYTGATIVVMALAASWATTDYLSVYRLKPVQTAEIEEADDQVEVVEVKPVSPEVKVVQETAGNVQVEEEKPIASEALDKDEAKEKKASDSKVSTPEEKTSVAKVVTFKESIYKKQYPGFRGPYGNGHSPAKNIPVEWDGAAGKNVKWKTAIPLAGFNSPIVWEDRIFLTGANETQRMVYCFNATNGELLWQHEANNIKGSPAKPPKVTEDTGLAAPSVACDGQAVYAIFGTGDLIALDLNGSRLWAKNLGVPDNHYGHSSSLLAFNKQLFVQYDTNKERKVMALNTTDGETIWETPRDVKISWASPVLATLNGVQQIILSSDPLVCGYDVKNGKELWSVKCMMGEVGPSVAVADGLVYATNEYAVMAAIKPGENPEIVWEDDEYLPEVASPVVSDGLLFVATSYGVMACYDAKTGEKLWEKEANEGFYASPMVADRKVYFCDMNGTCYIFNVNREAKQVGECELGESIYATPSFAEGRIFLRTDNHLYCISE
jgi:outer membrane protein assembly factor BamB